MLSHAACTLCPIARRLRSPGWLWLLLLLPPLWWFSFRRLAALGRCGGGLCWDCARRCWCSVILSLAEMQNVRTSEKLTVIYLLDQSVSIPEAQRRAMVDYVNADIKKHRHNDRGDHAGVIVFGRDAAIEHPPFDDDIQISPHAGVADRNRSHQYRRRIEAGDGVVSRRCGPPRGDRDRWQREPGQRHGASPGDGRGRRRNRRGAGPLSGAVRRGGRTNHDSARCEPRPAVRCAGRAEQHGGGDHAEAMAL